MAVEFHGVSSQPGRISKTNNDVFVDFDDANACKLAFSMSSGPYSGLVM